MTKNNSAALEQTLIDFDRRLSHIIRFGQYPELDITTVKKLHKQFFLIAMKNKTEDTMKYYVNEESSNAT